MKNTFILNFDYRHSFNAISDSVCSAEAEGQFFLLKMNSVHLMKDVMPFFLNH
jgi:hypothetical protein